MGDVTIISDEAGVGVIGEGGIPDADLNDEGQLSFSNVLEDEEDKELLREWGLLEEVQPTDETPKEDVIDTSVVNLSSEEIELLRKKADFGDSWMTAFRDDPKKAILGLLKSEAFDPIQRESLADELREIDKYKEAENLDLSDYVPQNEMETKLFPHLRWMTNGRADVEQAFNVHAQDIQHTYILTEALHAKLDALSEILDITLPSLDVKEVFEHFNKNAEGTLKDAVNKVYRDKALQAAKVEKQKRVERPDTLSNKSGNRGEKELRTIEEMYEEAGRILQTGRS